MVWQGRMTSTGGAHRGGEKMSKQHPSQTLRTLPFAQPTRCRRGSRLSPVRRRGSAGSSPSASPKRGAKLVVCDIQEDRLAVAVRELREETGMPFRAVGGD